MKYTNAFGVGNFRGFKNPVVVRLAPITLFTGINGSGKSSFVSAIRLLRHLDITVVPNIIRLDSDFLQSNSFDVLKNRNSDNNEISVIHQNYHNILADTVNLFITLVKKTDYKASLNSVEIKTLNNDTLMYMKFDDESGDTIYVNIPYFIDKLNQWKSLIEKYSKFHMQIASDESLPGEVWLQVIDTSDSNEEMKNRAKRKDLLDKEYHELVRRDVLTFEMRKSLKAYLLLQDPRLKSPQLAERFRKHIEGFKVNEVLHNWPLLNFLNEAPKKEINSEWLKAIISSRFPEYIPALTRRNATESIDTVCDFLKLNDYLVYEKKLVTDSVDKYLKGVNGAELEEYVNRNSYLIDSYFDKVFPSDFLKAISNLTIETSSDQDSESDIKWQFFSTPSNVKSLSNYIKIIYDEVFNDLKEAFVTVEHVPLNQINSDRLLEVSHPLNQLISENRKDLTNNQFVNKWLKEFGIGDELLIETPVEGLGYSIIIIENGVRKQLSDEGSGIIHLIHLLINLGVFQHEKADPILHSRTIILEEPETNMHPAWQSKLAEMFVDAHRMMRINFIIETHSEYIVRKLQNMVARGDADRDDIAIVYFGKANSKDGAIERRKIEINPDGSLTKEFGSGFYDEADTLAFELMKLRHTQKN